MTNWKDQPEDQWNLADKPKECNANRIVFYARSRRPLAPPVRDPYRAVGLRRLLAPFARAANSLF